MLLLVNCSFDTKTGIWSGAEDERQRIAKLEKEQIKETNRKKIYSSTDIYYKEKALHKHVTFLSKNKCLINKQIFIDEAKEIIFKSFSDILSLISGTYYPPRSKKVVNLIDRVKKVSFNKSTLGGCVIEKKDNNIEISKEFRVKKTGYQLGK